MGGGVRPAPSHIFIDPRNGWFRPVAQSHGPRTSRPTGTCARGARPGVTRATLPAEGRNVPLAPFTPPCASRCSTLGKTKATPSRPYRSVAPLPATILSRNTAIRRRRVCPDCGGRFTTFERVQLREIMVVKKSGRRVPFDRDKLQHSLAIALRKRPVDPERVERMVNGIVRQLESMGDGDVPSETIGKLVMDGLKNLDDVAYVRFASVYRNFREARDFEELIGELTAEEGEPEK